MSFKAEIKKYRNEKNGGKIIILFVSFIDFIMKIIRIVYKDFNKTLKLLTLILVKHSTCVLERQSFNDGRPWVQPNIFNKHVQIGNYI